MKNEKTEASALASETTEEPALTKKRFPTSIRRVSKIAALVVAIAIFGSIALFTTVIVMANSSSIRGTRAEFEFLRDLAGRIEAGVGGSSVYELSALDIEMLEINPDYVFWIRIDGTNIDYPVVRGSNNTKYINTSFYGEENVVGSIFMDYRNTGEIISHRAGGSLPHIILYGHNLQQGGMFSDLHKYRSALFLEQNDIITLTVHGETVEFRIFDARVTDVDDPAYFLNFNRSHSFPRFANRIDAPLRATQIITLSTCVSGGSDDARLVVQGYRLFN